MKRSFSSPPGQSGELANNWRKFNLKWTTNTEQNPYVRISRLDMEIADVFLKAMEYNRNDNEKAVRVSSSASSRKPEARLTNCSETVVKREPGRPRKTPKLDNCLSLSTIKRGPGRPRKKLDSDSDMDAADNVDLNMDRKRRGRPRKIPKVEMDSDSDKDSADNVDLDKDRRPLGRPKKFKLESTTSESKMNWHLKTEKSNNKNAADDEKKNADASQVSIKFNKGPSSRNKISDKRVKKKTETVQSNDLKPADVVQNMLCRICGALFGNIVDFSNHEKMGHQQILTRHCYLCGMNFFSKSDLFSHMLTHTAKAKSSSASSNQDINGLSREIDNLLQQENENLDLENANRGATAPL